MRVLKGHGTQNDFVVLPDLDAEIELRPAMVRVLCDRRAGLGADGVLRVVRCAKEPDGMAFAGQAEYFMDYRNADGSVAEMCGNGVRVFLRYLQRVGLVDSDAAVATRGGIKRVRADADGEITVGMGVPRILADRPVATVALQPGAGSISVAGTSVLMPNPHLVVPVPDATQLATLDLSRPPTVAPGRPDAQNVEFVLPCGPRHVRMRVHERGVGETRSCGTGICAAVVASASAEGGGADGRPWRVDVPGGTCHVVWRPEGGIELSGPAVIIGEVDLDDRWLERAVAQADPAQATGLVGADRSAAE